MGADVRGTESGDRQLSGGRAAGEAADHGEPEGSGGNSAGEQGASGSDASRHGTKLLC
jgi:hypothetical protein